jgi:hypothetical protein
MRRQGERGCAPVVHTRPPPIAFSARRAAGRPPRQREVIVRRGVYFLANDRVFEQAAAFLNSFRAANPDLPLCLIPFADDVERVAGLAGSHDFTVWRDDRLLRRCDAIGRRFHDGGLGMYRKLAAWHGDFDEFVYIDCDTVVLEDVGFVFGHLQRYDFVTAHSNIPDIRRYVWRESIESVGVLSARQIAYSANTGFVASRRGVLDVNTCEAGLDDALALAPHMALDCYEQPYLNYLMVTAGGRYTSLFAIALRTRDRQLPFERWAGDDLGAVRDGRVGTPGERPVLFVHWAGEWERARREGGDIPYLDLWRHYRYLEGSDA